MPEDPKIQMRDALEQIQKARAQAREAVVLLVMRRNQVAQEVTDLERLVADLDQKSELAEQINNPDAAATLRTERDIRQAELDRARARLVTADADADAAKTNLPNQEAQLQGQINDLQIRLREFEGSQIGAEAENLWNRATDKIRNLESELGAYSEIARTVLPPRSDTRSLPPDQSAEKNADQMLDALEARLGMPSAPAAPNVPTESGEGSNNPTRYIEFDLPQAPPPASPETPEEPTASASPAPDLATPTVRLAPRVPVTPTVEAPPPTPPVALAPAYSPFAPQPVAPPEDAELAAEAEPESREHEAPETPEHEIQAAPEPVITAVEEPAVEAITAVVEPVSEQVAAPEPEIAEAPEPIESAAPEPGEETPEPEAAEASEPVIAEPAVEPKEEVRGIPIPPHLSVSAREADSAPAMITAPQSRGETSSMDSTKRVRIAAIGTGNIFRGAHLPVYPDIAQAQLVALCDPDPQAQKLTKARYDALFLAKIEQARERKDTDTVDRLESDMASLRIFHDISEVIAEVKPDLVDICTQPFLHAPLSIQALEAGINVMCEKPISRSWLETERLLAAIQRTGKLYQHNENWLWDRDYYTAKKLVDAGAIGEPILMFLATAHGGPEGAGKFWNSDFGGGGALLDNGIHAIGASWYISGLDKRPTVVKAAQPYGMSIRMPNRILDGRFQKVTVDDDAHILIRFENEESGAWTTAHVEGSWSHRDSPDTAIIGTTGKIFFKNEDDRRYAVVLDPYDRESRRIEVSGPTWQHWPSSFYGEILNMTECVRNNVPSICSAQFGADCSAVVGASYLSEKNGREAVSVEEFKTFARSVAERFPNDPVGADNALIETLLSAVRK